jgi:3',5'-cyclic AMP phosphodiesterase CpdA
MRRVFVIALLVVALPSLAAAQDQRLPTKPGSLKFAVIGDAGYPGKGQTAVAQQMAAWRARFPFEFVLMTGDNLYGSERPSDYEKKFAIPFKALIDAGVKFYASLGNHDDPTQRFYEKFNMNGERYYSFKPPKPGIDLRGGVRFFALDSNYMSREQLQWLEKELAASGADWKVPFFHHPIYSSGEKHGADEALREQLEPLFVKYGVDVVFTGHEHFYERLKPQKGITYFVNGSAAKLRKGNIGETGMTARGFDSGYAFIIVEIAGDELFFQTIEAGGQTVDSGVIRRREAPQTTRH